MIKTLYYEESDLPTIYLDMDETLVNFLDGADKVLTQFNKPVWRDTYWNQYTELEANNLRWNLMKQQPYFWRDLELMPGALDLWAFTKQYKPCVLSHATEYMIETCKSEKLLWLDKHLGINNLNEIHLVDKRSDKQLYALNSNGRPNLLIDDYIKNCVDFRNSGGYAIQHITAEQTIEELKKLGFK